MERNQHVPRSTLPCAPEAASLNCSKAIKRSIKRKDNYLGKEAESLSFAKREARRPRPSTALSPPKYISCWLLASVLFNKKASRQAWPSTVSGLKTSTTNEHELFLDKRGNSRKRRLQSKEVASLNSKSILLLAKTDLTPDAKCSISNLFEHFVHSIRLDVDKVGLEARKYSWQVHWLCLIEILIISWGRSACVI